MGLVGVNELDPACDDVLDALLELSSPLTLSLGGERLVHEALVDLTGELVPALTGEGQDLLA